MMLCQVRQITLSRAGALAPILSILMVWQSVFAESGNSRSLCTHPDAAQPRIVEVVYEVTDSPLPCKVIYEKDGIAKEVAAARNSRGHCEKTERKIVLNLVKGGYQCEHTFTGFGAAEINRELVLNLFADNGDATAIASVAAPSSAKAATNAEAATSTTLSTDGLTKTTTIENMQTEFLDDEKHYHQFTHTHPLTDGGLAVRHSHQVLDTVDTPESRQNAGTKLPDTDANSSVLISADETAVNAVEPWVDRDSKIDSGTAQWALLSRSMVEESQAHRLAGELRRRWPNVTNRVVKIDSDDRTDWHVALGFGNDEVALASSMNPLDETIQSMFNVQSIDGDAASAETSATGGISMEVVPDDWARYALASCWAEGHRSSDVLSECSSVIVDEESFVNCFGGGFCAPMRYAPDKVATVVDILEILNTEDPIAVARDRVAQRMQGCEQLSDVTDAQFTECTALSLLDDRQRNTYECYQRSSSELAVLECAGNEEAADYARAWDRCGATGYAASACLLEESDNPYLQSASYCLDYEHAADIARCSVDANLSGDEALMMSCVSDYSESTERATCLARERLSDNEYAALNCAGLADSTRDYAQCIARDSDLVAVESLDTAMCLSDSGGLSATALLDCGGSRYVSTEIVNCLQYGIEAAECYDEQTIISNLAHDELGALAELSARSNEITRFRQELYAAQGGDLDQLLIGSNEKAIVAIEAETVAAEAEVVEAIDAIGAEATNAVKNIGTKTKNKLRGLFGQGN